MSDQNIPNPTNIKPGDDFYEKSEVASSKKSQDSEGFFFEPPAELIEIPSHGYLYNDITDDADVLEKGSVKIRPMTVKEEKILTTARLVKSGQALDLIFKNVIKTNIDPSQMLSSDRVFLMLWLRSISYGNVYKFNLQCPSCQGRFEHEVDLSQHPITEFTDENVSEPFEIKLAISGTKVLYRLPRGTDEIEIIKMQNQPKKMNDADDSIVRRLSSILIKVEMADGKEVPKKLHQQFVESLVARDASIFRKELEENDCGIEDIKDISCVHCGYEYDTPIPITENFFRTTE